jgi:hypothetical protein
VGPLTIAPAELIIIEEGGRLMGVVTQTRWVSDVGGCGRRRVPLAAARCPTNTAEKADDRSGIGCGVDEHPSEVRENIWIDRGPKPGWRQQKRDRQFLHHRHEDQHHVRPPVPGGSAAR